MDLTNFSPDILWVSCSNTPRARSLMDSWFPSQSPNYQTWVTRAESVSRRVNFRFTQHLLIRVVKVKCDLPSLISLPLSKHLFLLTSTLWSTDLWQHRYHFCTLSLLAFFSLGGPLTDQSVVALTVRISGLRWPRFCWLVLMTLTFLNMPFRPNGITRFAVSIYLPAFLSSTWEAQTPPARLLHPPPSQEEW